MSSTLAVNAFACLLSGRCRRSHPQLTLRSVHKDCIQCVLDLLAESKDFVMTDSTVSCFIHDVHHLISCKVIQHHAGARCLVEIPQDYGQSNYIRSDQALAALAASSSSMLTGIPSSFLRPGKRLSTCTEDREICQGVCKFTRSAGVTSPQHDIQSLH